MDHLEAAALLAGASRAENKTVSQPTNVHLVTMEAVAASEDGTVLVDPGGDVFTPDDSQYVEIETVGSISEGDDVTVLLTGEPGGPMDVLSLGPIGEGDRQNAAIADAAQAAQTAWEYADSAHDAADAAQQSADDAAAAASSAQGSATRANTAANDALAQLGTVQDVLGVVEWVTEHGTWSLTTDTAVDESKVYYTRTGSGTTADPYVYSAVAEPTAEGLQGYYELSIDAALSQYVASHLSLTDAGLYVIRDASGYKLLVSSDGMSVIDPQGHVVTKQGENITFDSSRPQYIGGEDAYIVYYDSDEDGSPDTIRIGGHVLMGGDKTLSEVLAELDETAGIDTMGRNLLRKTATVTASDLARTRASVPEPGIIRLTPTTSASYAKFKVDYLDYADYGEGAFTVSFDARLADVSTSYTSTNVGVYVGFSLASRTDVVFSSTYDRYCPMKVLSTELASEWVRCSTVIDVPGDLTSGKATALVAGSQLSVELAVGGSRKPVEVRNVKLERGTKATAWSLAPEDVPQMTSDAIATAAADATAKANAAESNAISAAAADATTKASNAAKTATNYIQSDSAGIRIADDNPATATTYQHQTATGTEFVVNGTSMAEFGGDGARIGASDTSHMELDYHSMRLIDKDGNEFFNVNDLRGTDGTAEIVEEFTVVSLTDDTYYLSFTATDRNYTVTVSDSSGGTATKELGYFNFSDDLTLGATITTTYRTADARVKAYTLGARGSGKVGAYSLVEGYNNVASGPYSHAEGNSTKAHGQHSHAGGLGTVANGNAQTVVGRFNNSDNVEYAFIVGNGTSDSDRSNAFAVRWDGEVVGALGKTLYENDSATTGDLTGLPSLTNYSRLLIEFRDSGGRGGSVWVDKPSSGSLVNQYFNCVTVGGNSATGMITRAKTYFIESATAISMSRDSYNRYDYSKVTVSPTGGVTFANANEIGITKVIGFR